MKIISKEAAVWGGWYISTGYIVSLFDNTYPDFYEIAVCLVSFIFFIGLILMFSNKTPKLLRKFIERYPNFSNYFASIGWLPYFIIIGVPLLIWTAMYFDWSKETKALVGSFVLDMTGLAILICVGGAIGIHIYKTIQSKKN